jgi:hypothetical protein
VRFHRTAVAIALLAMLAPAACGSTGATGSDGVPDVPAADGLRDDAAPESGADDASPETWEPPFEVGEGVAEAVAPEALAPADVAADLFDLSPVATVAFVEPSSPCANPVTLRVAVTGSIARVAYDADGWSLGVGTDAAAGFPLTYAFQQTGERVLHAEGQSASGEALAEAWRTVVVEPDAPGTLPDVPYFYQYDNDLSPSSTCQNTSVAMLLAWLGWTGEPDDVTAAWGKDHAQEPAGLAEVFNSYAVLLGLPQRLVAHVDGTVDDVRALLAEGRPVIVHGYFTAYGHVLVALGFDGASYVVNDPAGAWSQQFQGGYPGAYDAYVGHGIAYDPAAFDAAIATSDGRAFLPVWYHELLGPVASEGP